AWNSSSFDIGSPVDDITQLVCCARALHLLDQRACVLLIARPHAFLEPGADRLDHVRGIPGATLRKPEPAQADRAAQLHRAHALRTRELERAFYPALRFAAAILAPRRRRLQRQLP